MNKSLKIIKPDEWLKQGQYDLDTARVLFDRGRYIYCVCLCHGAVEKVLKALFVKRIGQDAPRDHLLAFFVDTQEVVLPEDIRGYLEYLDNVSAPALYLENLEKALKEYDKTKAREILNSSHEAFRLLRKIVEAG